MPLSDDLLTRIRSRAGDYDRENAYFTAFVPAEHGGGGLTLPEMVEVQMRLAGAAGSTPWR